ncbi:MAG TPA: alpha-amylase/4-alpha-glucanotransferase domain-containing protein [Ktedonobacteraceae bacterium]|nr:alpha-amylase/4-alpha-glucanotransferase domain-containing protein [Ktedonobacteraceae bacterium]
MEQGKSIHLGLLLHNHQPVGNFPWVFQQVYEASYLPLIEALERHARIRLSLHYTGSLLDWLSEAHPEFLRRITALVRRKQVEMVSGGYYEPVLSSIPDADKRGQIHKLSERLRTEFKTEPGGMWLAERVWEPGLPGLLREAGIEWTILDDVHFKSVGLEDSDLYGYYATEDQSPILKLFATSQAMRYTVPWRPGQETIELLRSLATRDGARIVAMGDDGEKFGSWPGTREYCWGKDGRSGWVEDFFKALERNSSWLHTTPLGEYARAYGALGRIYIPTSSYSEMTEWALPSRKAYTFGQLLHTLQETHEYELLQFMRGGFWRNFLVRYPEVNNQHKKMLRVHDAVYAAGATEEHGLRHLWKAQANDTYWHGLFGGVYMGHVRSAIYHHLIKAENAAQRARQGTDHWQLYEFTDFDRDSRDELLIEGDLQNLYLDPQRGGTLFEWDLRRSMHNLLCVMTRYEESYHRTLREHEQERRRREAAPYGPHLTKPDTLENPHITVRTKEPDLDRLLIVDPYRRASLVDHFLAPATRLEHFMTGNYEELGNFVAQPYEAVACQDGIGITATLEREGQVRRYGALPPQKVLLTKALFVPNGREELMVRYTIQNKSEARLHTRFACEWNIHLLGGGNEQAYYHFPERKLRNVRFDSTGENEHIEVFALGNTWLQQHLEFALSKPATHWRYSLETVTGSEAGFERNHQGSCLTLLWPVLLEPGQSWQVEIACTGSASG